ncbi:helix-turn-helix domain-containing protein [Bacillus cereus]|uniref:Transposase IS30-like HTH domain-containing protein n=2 Tax=Bacillus cereus group TaxID=86661 RepID=A0A9W5KR96_BACCE|nr:MULTISPECIES: helix-turn-helix domain-containing protein [Bacillus cereus group]MEB8751766.1 helix-turn-helix domain-containing protein [Bacillus cereus]EJR63042.1 hypothetical protein IK5_05886 [Bacillus cereus VD154]KIU73333.1 hypothetical protein C797_18532 [Bacillus thuringiensis Sbt003]MEB8764389.1 helix-turn-helix domain-containing protein [Bacillus cereus]MEB8895418.1 helix-turn-helix domain-containing protein [Bacillus cereus]
MRPVPSRIHFFNLQEQHCKNCQFQYMSSKQCIEECEVGKELTTLNEKAFKRRNNTVLTPKEKWNDKCKEAVSLFEQGMEYPDIAKKIGCHVSSLYRELKKRKLLFPPKTNS